MSIPEIPKKIAYKDFYATWDEKENRDQEFPSEVLEIIAKWLRDNNDKIIFQDMHTGYAEDEYYIRVYYFPLGRWEDATLR